MTSRIIVPPEGLAISLETARASLRLDDDSQDVLIKAWVRGITGFAENYLQRALITQTRRVTLDGFPDSIQLDGSPVQAIVSIQFYDVDNILRTLDPADYLLDNVSEPGYVVPDIDCAWPEAYDRVNAVMVDYLCGYGDSEASVPDQIKLYVLAKLAEQFDSSARTEKPTVQSSFLDRLLDGDRIYA
jgi:uncharacterized phiE125 gp8 family phage protein